MKKGAWHHFSILNLDNLTLFKSSLEETTFFDFEDFRSSSSSSELVFDSSSSPLEDESELWSDDFFFAFCACHLRFCFLRMNRRRHHHHRRRLRRLRTKKIRLLFVAFFAAVEAFPNVVYCLRLGEIFVLKLIVNLRVFIN